VKLQRGCSDDFQTYSIATDSNCRSKGSAMRTAAINDFRGQNQVDFFAAESPINPSVYSHIRYGPDLLSKITIHGRQSCFKVTKLSESGHTCKCAYSTRKHLMLSCLLDNKEDRSRNALNAIMEADVLPLNYSRPLHA
jgi:hypothetical protein